MSDLTRSQELWIRKLMVKPEWTYPEALLWVAFRHGRTVAELLHFGESPLYTDGAGVVQGTCLLLARDQGSCEPEPVAALEVALLAGAVQAFGDFPNERAGGPPWKIPAADWQYLVFRDDTRWKGPSIVVDPRRWHGRYSGSSDGVLINVRFSRESVMAAFPEAQPGAAEDGRLTLVAVASPPGVGRPNVPKRGLSDTRWLALPEVDEVARARVKAAGKDPEDERVVQDELLSMLKEQGHHIHPPSLQTLRRRAGFKLRRD